VDRADAEPRRIDPTRHRVALAKAALGIGAALAFGGALALSRLYHAAGQSKQPVGRLAPTHDYVAAVRKDVGSAGIIDPPLAFPTYSTHVS
jgi:hypothetical protein